MMRICASFLLVTGASLFFGLSAADTAAVAQIGNRTISASELDQRAHDKLKEQHDAFELHQTQLRLGFERERYALLAQELNKMLDEQVLSLEAAARKTDAAALSSALRTPLITNEAVQTFYDEHKADINQPFGAVATRIHDYLAQRGLEGARRAYLDELRAKYHAVEYLEPFRDRIENIGPQRGSAQAAVTVVEFADFQCPYCGQFESAINQMMAKYPSQVKFIYRNYPLREIHPDAQKAAEAGVCAERQGKYWEMHDLMFSDQANLGIAALKEKAAKLGVDPAAFGACLDKGDARAAVQADADAGNALGLSGTPATFINGRLVRGTATLEELSRVIDAELQRAAPTARR